MLSFFSIAFTWFMKDSHSAGLAGGGAAADILQDND